MNSTGFLPEKAYLMTYVGESSNNILLMEPSDFREFFTYNHKVRQSYIVIFQRILTWQDMTANRETAWFIIEGYAASYNMC
ncbi:hypothetical protein BH18THE2_BH18THE2_43330 [soil metagenome]